MIRNAKAFLEHPFWKEFRKFLNTVKYAFYELVEYEPPTPLEREEQEWDMFLNKLAAKHRTEEQDKKELEEALHCFICSDYAEGKCRYWTRRGRKLEQKDTMYHGKPAWCPRKEKV